MARIAITGGTGFVGTHTTRALLDAGHDIVLLARGERRLAPRPEAARFVRADVIGGTGLVDAFRGCDVVVNLVAIIRARGKQTFDRVNRQGTENVAKAAHEAGVGHLIQVSALGAGPDPAYPYFLSKWGGEQAVRASGVPFTILRPSLLFGPGDGFFTLLARLIRLNPLITPVAGDGSSLFQPLAVRDLARIVAEAVDRGPSHRVDAVGGPDQLSYDELIATIRDGLGLRRRTVHIPVPVIMPIAFVMDKLLPHPPVTPDQLRMLAKHNVTERDGVLNTWGFNPTHFSESLEYLEAY